VLPTELDDDELLVVRDALVTRPAWLELAQALEAAATERGTEGLRMLSIAFVYDLIEAPGDRRDRAGSPYASMWEDESGSYPPRPSQVISEVRSVWRSTCDAIDDPIVVARLSDLAFVADGPRAHVDGRAGATAHLQLAQEQTWTALDRAACAARALGVLADLNDRAGLTAAASSAVAIVDELLEQEHPGPPFIVLRALTRLKPKQRPGHLGALLERVIARFDDSRNKAAALAVAVDATADAERKTALRQRHLDVVVDEARSAEGLAKVTFLQRASDLARRYGFGELAAELLHELQELPEEELGFVHHSEEVEIPREQVDRTIDSIVGSEAADILDALGRLGSLEAPGGSNSDVESYIIEMEQKFPLANLFGQQVFGPHASAPQFIANTQESKRRAACGRHRTMTANFYGEVLFGPMLVAALKHHGRPDHELLVEHFTTDVCDADRADRVAHALELFWDGDYDSSAHVLVPRIEATLRDLARAVGVTVVTPAAEGKFTGYITLGAVLRKLRELEIDVAWFDYLEALLCEPLAKNLRNDIAHGLVSRVRGVDAALLVHAACHLALIRLTEQ
jgi:hypothetical protein